MKKTLYIILLLILGMHLSAQSVWDGRKESIRHGSGTASDPYLIESAQNLAWLVYVMNWDYGSWTKGKYFLLTTDIDLDGGPDNQWIPIGAGITREGKDFWGFFDGGYHKITGLYIDEDSEIYDRTTIWRCNNVGLFCVNRSTIKNLYLEGEIYGKSSNRCGGLSGRSNNIENCIVNVEIESNNAMVGGITPTGNDIKNCANIGNIILNHTVVAAGGIVAGASKIENCYNTGNITITATYANAVGGIAGQSTSIKNCYNVGNIASSRYCGAIIGSPGTTDSIVNCYYSIGCIEENNGIGIPMIADFMRTHEFVNMLNNGTDIWAYDENNINDGYPVLGLVYDNAFDNFFDNTDLVILYPNPIKDNICLIGDVASFEIYDMVGKCVMRCGATQSCVSADDLQSGVYIVRCIMRNGNIVTKKIVKE